ncbi:MAG: GNAT family N-acetyltransferase [Pseudomonadales bacterium]|nr:GNAT family N-acetyltransferase [Pseudomonadales bacterium]
MEEAALNAWPALREILYDGWVVRLTRGFTRRANSVTPLHPGGARPLEERIAYCEALYARHGLPACFRLPAWPEVAPLRAALDARGYRAVGAAAVLRRELAPPPGDPRPDELSADGTVRWLEAESWLDVYTELTGTPAALRELHALVLAGIVGECLFAVRECEDRPVACLLGVLEDDLVGLFDLATLPAARRRGHAATLVEAVAARAAGRGAREVYLQVEAANAPGLALYARLGFSRLHDYDYRIAPP